jgi:cyclophilin family peptidyl-prolyl cis-trans isomerase
VSRKQHQRQLDRARSKRRTSRQDRRQTRNRVIVYAIVAVMVLSLFTPALIRLLSDDAASDPAAAPDATDDATDDTTDASDTEVPPGELGPCGPTPSEVPSPAPTLRPEPFELTIDPEVTYVATIETTCGTIVAELAADRSPQTVNNFVNLAREGYYAGIVFHRVIPGFVAQAGDPTGTGAGPYPGYRFADELALAEELFAGTGGEGYPRGTLAMANAGPDTNGSQFFITQGDPTLLPGPLYAAFGQVVSGMEVVDDIVAATTGERDRPLADIVIVSVTIEER